MTPQLIFFISFSILSNFAKSQEQVRQIELTPFVRIDKFPQFSYVWGRPSTDYVNIKGISFVFNLAYKIPVTKSVLLKPGIGYYKYSFNNIKKVNTLSGQSNVRDIGFVSPVYILFFTNKYSYNTVVQILELKRLLITKAVFKLLQE